MRAITFLIKLIILVFSLVVVTLLSTWITTNIIFLGRDVSVPTLVGLTENQANAKLNQYGLKLKIDQRRHSESFEEGRIFFQDPAEGTRLKRNRTVKVLISLGVPTINLSDFTAMSLRKTILELGRMNLKPGAITKIYHEKIPENSIIAHDPPPGVRALNNQKVDLLVSSGTRPWTFIMPDLKWLPENEVTSLLQGYRLKIASRVEKETQGIRDGLIIAQSPPFGAPVSETTPIRLTVSRMVELPVR